MDSKIVKYEKDTRLSGAAVLQAIIEGERPFRPNVLDLGDAQSQYETLFWRPYLGAPAWGLYESLRAFAACDVWESINVEMLALTMGQGSRATILGRQGGGGAAARLEDERVVDHLRRGRRTRTGHVWAVLPRLPALTPAQAGRLDGRLADMHEWYLGSVRGFDLPGWRGIEAGSLVDEAVRVYGRVVIGK